MFCIFYSKNINDLLLLDCPWLWIKFKCTEKFEIFEMQCSLRYLNKLSVSLVVFVKILF